MLPVALLICLAVVISTGIALSRELPPGDVPAPEWERFRGVAEAPRRRSSPQALDTAGVVSALKETGYRGQAHAPDSLPIVTTSRRSPAR